MAYALASGSRLTIQSFPSTRSTTQHPRTCGAVAAAVVEESSLSHPASWSASARIGIAEKSRDSYICRGE